MNNYDLAGMKAKQDAYDARAAALRELVDAFVLGFIAELNGFAAIAQTNGLRGITKATVRTAANKTRSCHVRLFDMPIVILVPPDAALESAEGRISCHMPVYGDVPDPEAEIPWIDLVALGDSDPIVEVRRVADAREDGRNLRFRSPLSEQGGREMAHWLILQLSPMDFVWHDVVKKSALLEKQSSGKRSSIGFVTS